MKAYQNLLMRMNRYSGRKIWWPMWGLGVFVVIVWVAADLPFVGVVIGWGMIGRVEHLSAGGTALTLYGFWSIPEPWASYYMAGVIFSIAIMKAGQLLAILSYNYGRGLKYYPPCAGAPTGFWA